MSLRFQMQHELRQSVRRRVSISTGSWSEELFWLTTVVAVVLVIAWTVFPPPGSSGVPADVPPAAPAHATVNPPSAALAVSNRRVARSAHRPSSPVLRNRNGGRSRKRRPATSQRRSGGEGSSHYRLDPRAAEAFELALLQDTQQLGLADPIERLLPARRISSPG